MGNFTILRCPFCNYGSSADGVPKTSDPFLCARCTNIYTYGEYLEYTARQETVVERENERMKRDVDSYLETINRLEKDISPIDASAAYASQSISLKRIADACEAMVASLEKLAYPPLPTGSGGDLPEFSLFNPDGSRKFPK